MVCITSFLSYNDSFVPSVTGTTGVSAHKHTVVSECVRELIIEGLKHVRMECRERAQASKFTLIKRTCPGKESVWSPYTSGAVKKQSLYTPWRRLGGEEV
jgi:hypothetical protein